MMNNIHKRLRELRESMNISQTDLCTLLNIKISTYNGYEVGTRNPNYATLIKLAKFFNVSTDYLLGVQNKKSCKGIERDILEDIRKFLQIKKRKIFV